MELKSQVTIGAGIEPENYSILQLEGTTGGLRINQLDTVQIKKLTNILNDSTANGLVIYNKNQHCIQYWDKDKWHTVVTELPEIKTIKYIKNEVTLGANAPINSLTVLGDLMIRLTSASTGVSGELELEFSFLKRNAYAIHYFKTGVPIGHSLPADNPYHRYDRSYLNIGKWAKFPETINATNRDIATATIVMNNSKQIYRVSVVINGQINILDPTDGILFVPPQIIIFIEKLGDD